ncbi:MAG: hypothetical protein OEV66_11170 [Spirochaetia bacterium]|nr:hypothetical protein [Spirochaetia bacterium]
MPSKFEFDETRNAIGADKLQADERKAMLDKFKSGGGKVLSEKELREKKRQETQSRQPNRSRDPGRKPRAFEDDDAESVSAKKGDPQKGSGSLTRLILKFKTFFEGLTPFGSDSIKPGFVGFLGLDVKQALVEFNLIGNDLFLQDRNIGKKIAIALDQKSPVLMELLQKLHKLFDSKDMVRLFDFHQNNPNINVPFNMAEESLRNLFRKLYYVYPFQETIKKALNLAVEVYSKETGDENNKTLMEQKRKKFIKDVDIVFAKAFPKLFSLISRMDGVEYAPFSPNLEKSLQINQDEKIGKRKKGEGSNLTGAILDSDVDQMEEGNESGEETGESAEIVESEEKETKPESPSAQILNTKEYQYGLKLMKQNPITALRQKHDPHRKYTFVLNNDRALLAYLFFLEFDTELSFTLTTKKIILAPDYSSGTKKDYKQILADTFNQSRGVIQAFENYAEARKNFQGYEKQHSSGANYVEASKRKEGAKVKMEMEGRNVRGLVRSYMDNVTRMLALLITDMKSEKKIVQNMDQPLAFDSEREGSKRLNGQPVKQCILETYCYSMALNERLTNGDLFGGILDMTDEEMIASFGSTFKESVA